MIRCRRALKSHSEVLAMMTDKNLEARDVTVRLKGIIEGTGRVDSAGDLHFDMLQVPWNKERLLFNTSHPR